MVGEVRFISFLTWRRSLPLTSIGVMAPIIVLLEIEPSEVGNSPTMMKDSLITFSLLLPPAVRDKTSQGKLSLIGLIKASPSPSVISHARKKTKQISKAR